ncbi:MAG: hypothetical protein GY820_38350 [Gammaproteobacteria bacterium]|nr:hypothetical protein [Gammaproteobacteria bacterium]
MDITTSNVLADVTPSVTTGSNTESTPADIVDPDFSNYYISASTSTLVISMGATTEIDYVAIAGLNIEGNADSTSYVSVKNDTTEIQQIYVNTNQVVILKFTAQAFTDLIITIYNGAENLAPIVKYIAAGNLVEVPNSGEQSGYNRQFLQHHFKNKVTYNSETEPVAIVRKRVQSKGKLSIPNASKAFSEGDWQTFLVFAIENLFFILERDAELISTKYYAPAAYLCYEMDINTVKAHPSTRELNSLSIGFKVYNGL